MKIHLPLLFFVWLTVSSNIFACQCHESPPISEYIKDSFAIFSGKVINYRDVPSLETNGRLGTNTKADSSVGKTIERIYRIKIIEQIKGRINAKIININAGNINSTCFRTFEVGQEYLIDGYGKSEKEVTAGIACGLTNLLEFSRTELYFLRKLLDGWNEPHVYGVVKTDSIDEKNGLEKSIPKPGIKVVVEGEGKTFETITNQDGVYEFSNLPTGRYSIKAIPPKDMYFSTLWEDKEFFVTKNRKLLYGDAYKFSGFSRLSNEEINQKVLNSGHHALFENLYIGWKNYGSGKIVDLNKKTLKFAKVELVPVNFPFVKTNFDNVWEQIKDEYFCSSKPPGQYLLAYEVNSFAKNGKRERFFYPATKNPKKARIFKIGSDAFETDIQVPVKVHRIKGKVLWSDGTPFKGEVQIYLTKDPSLKEQVDLEEKSLDRDNLSESDEEFIFEGFEGNEYWLNLLVWATSDKPGADEDGDFPVKVKPVKIRVGKSDKQLKILIPKPADFHSR